MTTTNSELQINVPDGQPYVELQRFFNAPPELVYRALTEGELLARWWGPRRLETVECDVDLHIGGSWRIVHRAPDGTEFGFHGEILELDPPRRRVGTWVWEGAPEASATETFELEAVEGGTMLYATMTHNSVENRDMHLANGMEGGMTESYARLDELLADLAS
jgi:uncharacterized protein YndB with AHSA1/START domain